MLAIIVMMNGYERGSWKLLKWLFFSTAGGFFSDACAYAFGERVDRFSVIATRISYFFFIFAESCFDLPFYTISLQAVTGKRGGSQ